MSKKLTNNGLFDSSRFMLPEHKEAILDEFKRQQRKIRPSLDRQQLDYIAATIARSALDQTSVTLTVYDELAGETSVAGVVKKMDQQLQRIKVAAGDNIEWIPFEDILNVE
jgi:predicted RNase H-like nuclease (RuvC/YqgF family)